MLSNLSTAAKSPVKAIEVIAIFAAFVIATIILLFVKKIYYRVFLKKRYYIFPKMSVKGITNVAMVISISIAAIILLTFLTAGFMAVIFRAYPGWRSTIEGVLIKIGGLLFGPIIGLFIGAFTDLLTVGMTAGMFHYGYFIVAMAYGFFSGIVRTIITLSKDKEISFLTLSTIFLTFIAVALFLFIYYMDITTYVVSFLGFDISINKEIMLIIFGVMFGLTLLILWVCALSFDFWKVVYSFQALFYVLRFVSPIKKYRRHLSSWSNAQNVADKHLNWVVKNEKSRQRALSKMNKSYSKIDFTKIKLWFNYFAPVLITVFSCEAIVEILIMPVFDLDFSIFSYDYWFTFRLVMFVFMSPINVLIIFPIYRIVCPSMRYNYQNDLSESVYIPLMVN